MTVELHVLNYFITIVKLHMWISRKQGVAPNLTAFKEIVKVKFRIEKYIKPLKTILKLSFRLDGNYI